MTDALHKPEIEYALLARILRDNTVLDTLDRLQPEHLVDAEIRAHHEAAVDLRREGRPV